MDKNKRPLIPVSDYSSNSLNLLRLKTSEQLALLKIIKAAMPVALQPYILHCTTRAKTLSVFTASANWATALRFHGQVMLAAANAHTAGNLMVLRVKILPDVTGKQTKHRPFIPAQTVVDALKSHSESVTDPQLKASLMRLSSTLSRLQQNNR